MIRIPGELSAKLTERLHQICHDLSVSAYAEPPPLPGEALDLCTPHGFPYEGKLSAVRLTDEVDCAA